MHKIADIIEVKYGRMSGFPIQRYDHVILDL